jgi:hypothetical protein
MHDTEKIPLLQNSKKLLGKNGDEYNIISNLVLPDYLIFQLKISGSNIEQLEYPAEYAVI